MNIKNVNAELRKVLPYRTLGSIKRVRRKSNKRYHNILKSLESEDDDEIQATEPAPELETENTGRAANNVEDVDWVEELLSQMGRHAILIWGQAKESGVLQGAKLV